MNKLIVLGSGAAPGVPSISCGWGNCNPENPKNCRTRTDIYVEIDGVKLLIDTSPDVRQHLLDNEIRELDGVLYTHTHADHLHGIDDLREINRLHACSLNIYGSSHTIKHIKKSFSYLIASKKGNDVFICPSLFSNVIKANHPFYIKNLKISPLKQLGHNAPSLGYAFNDGEVVYLSDFKSLASSVYKQILHQPKLLVLPLTTPYNHPNHATLEEVLKVIKEINPEHTIINHMASECDYDDINARTPSTVEPAFDGIKFEWKRE